SDVEIPARSNPYDLRSGPWTGLVRREGITVGVIGCDHQATAVEIQPEHFSRASRPRGVNAGGSGDLPFASGGVRRKWPDKNLWCARFYRDVYHPAAIV